MQHSSKISLFPWLTLGLGLPGALLMFLLGKMGVDSRGLFIPWHWTSTLLGCLAVAMAGITAWNVRSLGGKMKFSALFPASPMAAVGTLAAALGILLTAADSLTASEPVRIFSGILKIAAAVALIYLAWCRWSNQRASFLVWGVVTGYLMVRLMFEYQDWSSDPQLLSYFYPLISSVCMTLAFYQRTALAVRMGSRRLYLFFTQVGAFCALAAFAAEVAPFYAGMALWALTDLCSQKAPNPRGKYSAQPPAAEDAA